MSSDPFPAPLAAARPRLLPLLGLPAGGTAFNPALAWRRRPDRDRYRLPFGITADRTAVELDLKDPAYGGMGPHGLVAGVAGSGKSELLRTLVLGLLTTHAPTSATVALVECADDRDTFRDLASAPHVAWTMAGIADAPARLGALRDTLTAELDRRIATLNDTGFRSAADYTAARDEGADLPPLPLLLIVVDDLQLLPDFATVAETFRPLARLGRSLRTHLVLSTQRYEPRRWHGLDRFMSYRIALRCVTEDDSTAVLDRPDAAALPREPGVGYLTSWGVDPVPVKVARAGPVPAW